MMRRILPSLAALLLILCLAISPAAATWSPPTDTGIYGVEWNASDPSPTLQWIDASGDPISKPNFDNHVIWGNIKRVILWDNGTVLRDVNPRGDNLDLTPEGGAVMTEIPKFYAMSENASRDGYRYYRWWISPTNETGFELFPAFLMRGGTERDYLYVGSYEATLEVNDTGTLTLDSRTGEQPWTGYISSPADGMFKVAFTGGTDEPAIGATVTGNTSGTAGQIVDYYVTSGSWAGDDAAGVLYLKQTTGTYTDDEPLKISGSPFATADTPTANTGLPLTINDAEAYGENNGAGYGSINIWSYNAVRLLYHIEAGSWASQETTGLGIVSKASGTGFAGEITGFASIDTLMAENGTGQGSGSAGYTSVAYRTIENLWGNTWSWITGYTSTNTEYQITKRDGTGSLATHPLADGSYESSAATPLGADGYVYGYWTSLFHEDLLQYQFIANSVTGGSQSTYGTDYQYSHSSGTRVLRAGGDWTNGGRIAGLGSLYASSAASYSLRYVGARLEFTGAATLNGAAPAAQYTLNASAGNAPLAVQFTDTSTGSPSWWRWDFGDGTTSTTQSPAHTYDTAGTYNVTLTAYTLYGSDTYDTTITVLDAPAANFTPSATAGNAPLAVNFTDTSTGSTLTTWHWTFGDGTNSTDQHPAHTYTDAGTYTVALNVSNAYGSDTETKTDLITVLAPPAANFTADDTTPAVGTAVTFTDASTGDITAWSWSFGDGATSADQHPTHTYAAAGLYTVALNVSNAYGYNISTLTDYIDAGVPPTAAFSTADTTVAAGVPVNFTDASTDTPTAWSWTFGDGQTSTEQSPSHTYAATGTYTVSLTASNAYGESTETKTAYMDIGTAPTAAFNTAPYGKISLGTSVVFWDLSTGGPTSWFWDFGDGTNSTEQSPEHAYTTVGIYSVSLTATNIYGESTHTKTNRFDVYYGPVSDFHVSTTVAQPGVSISYYPDCSYTTSYWWHFGDGAGSTSQYPTHSYAAPGLYTVDLVAISAYGSDTEVKTDYIDIGYAPTAAFSANDTTVAAGDTVLFTDASTNTPTSWSWSFGDGQTSTEQHPTHTYAATGTYTVTLTATNIYGSDGETKTAYIDVGSVPVSAFSAADTTVIPGATVTFTDASTGSPTAWSWDFGDGATSTAQNPTHAYAAVGTYTVALTATNAYGSGTPEVKTGYIDIGLAPDPDFSADVTISPTGSPVQFTDLSTQTPTAWSWSFGDGQTSTAQSPSHTYAAAGIYTVSLTATNAYGSGTETKTAYLDVGDGPAAAFAADDTTVAPGATVTFTDASTHSPTSWAWTFGDGTTSTAQNPTHAYAAVGTYTVTLTATNAYASDTETKTAYISVGLAPTAAFTVSSTAINAGSSVTFTDLSTQTPNAWSWSFGDGTTSTTRHPSHTYSTPGTYTVTLTATNTFGSDTETKTAYITVGLPAPSASFTVNMTTTSPGRAIQFTDTSTGTAITAWHWTFGDGSTSTAQNPSHTYTREGTFSVVLKVTNAYGYDTAAATITVTDILPYAGIRTDDATGLSTSSAVLHGAVLTGQDTEVWFVYGGEPGTYAYSTAKQTSAGAYGGQQKGFPLVAGQTYYYRAACAQGYGDEKSFSLPAVTARATTTYSEAGIDLLRNSEEDRGYTALNESGDLPESDGGDIYSVFYDALTAPYVAIFGSFFFALLIGGVFMNIALKGGSLFVPALLSMGGGSMLWSMLPPEAAIMGQSVLIFGIAGFVFWLFTDRK